jgi:hypothetical protein
MFSFANRLDASRTIGGAIPCRPAKMSYELRICSMRKSES